MSQHDQPTLAEQLARQGKQPASDIEAVHQHRQAVSKQKPGNASYWAEKRKKRRKAA